MKPCFPSKAKACIMFRVNDPFAGMFFEDLLGAHRANMPSMEVHLNPICYKKTIRYMMPQSLGLCLVWYQQCTRKIMFKAMSWLCRLLECRKC